MIIDDVQVLDATRFPIQFPELRTMMGWSFGAEGIEVADLWQSFNQQLWNGALIPCPMFFPTATPYGHWIGLYSRNADYQTIHIQLKFGLNRQSKADVLLHEMIHQFLGESRQNTKHNAIPWCSEIMRLTREIWGVDIHASPDCPRKVNGRSIRVQKPSASGQASITRKQIAAWPWSLSLAVPVDRFLNYSQLQVVA